MWRDAMGTLARSWSGRIGSAIGWNRWYVRLLMAGALVTSVSPRERLSLAWVAALVCARSLPYGRAFLPRQVWLQLSGARFLLGVGRGELDGFRQVWVEHAYEKHSSFHTQP